MLKNTSFFVLLTKFLAIVFLGIGWTLKCCENKEVPFVTHKLIILPEADIEEYTSVKTLLPIGQAKLNVLFSSTLWKALSNEGSKKSFKGYHFWEAEPPEARGKSFILGIHKKYLSFDQGKITPKCEKELGIYINKLSYIGSFNYVKKAKVNLMPVRQEEIEHSNVLKNILQDFFIESDCYKGEAPRWLIVIDGHGKPLKFSKDTNIIENDGLICHINTKILGDIINDLNEKIDLLHLHFHSCYVGRVLLKRLSYQVPSTKTILTSSSFSGDTIAPVLEVIPTVEEALPSGKEVIPTVEEVESSIAEVKPPVGEVKPPVIKQRYEKFLEEESKFKIKKKLLAHRNEKLREAFITMFTQAAQHLLPQKNFVQKNIELFSHNDNHENFPIFGFNLPCIKWPGIDNTFFLVPQSGKLLVLTNKTLPNLLNPLKPSIILCTGEPIGAIRVVSYTKKSNKDPLVAYPYFTAGIEGLFAQTIEELTVPSDLTGLQLFETLFPEFFYAETDKAASRWCLHIKKLVIGGEEKSVRAIFDKKEAKILFYKKGNTKDYEYYIKKRKSKESEENLTNKVKLNEAKKETFKKEWKQQVERIKLYLATLPPKSASVG